MCNNGGRSLACAVQDDARRGRRRPPRSLLCLSPAGRRRTIAPPLLAANLSPVEAIARSRLIRGLERLVEVLEDVLDVLDPNAHADEVLFNPKVHVGVVRSQEEAARTTEPGKAQEPLPPAPRRRSAGWNIPQVAHRSCPAFARALLTPALSCSSSVSCSCVVLAGWMTSVFASPTCKQAAKAQPSNDSTHEGSA